MRCLDYLGLAVTSITSLLFVFVYFFDYFSKLNQNVNEEDVDNSTNYDNSCDNLRLEIPQNHNII